MNGKAPGDGRERGRQGTCRATGNRVERRAIEYTLASPSRTFWYTYAGSAIGGCWFMIIGALGGILAPGAISSNTAGYFAGLFPAIQWLILLTAVLGIFAANVENLYRPFLASPHFLTDLSNFVLFLLYFMIPWTAINQLAAG